MSGKRKASDLQIALESFARRARGLTVENLEIFPDVLNALFGEDALADPDERLLLAAQVHWALMRIIDDCHDAVDRHVGNVLLAVDRDLHGMKVEGRLHYMKYQRKIDLESVYYDRRKKLVLHVVGELRKEFSDGDLRSSDAVLSAEARRAARQAYRYSQNALVLVEAYSFCVGFAWWLKWSPRSTGRFPREYDWLRDYLNGPKNTHLVPVGRSEQSDSALLSYTLTRRHLRILLEDRTGRDYLHEHLPKACWVRIQNEAPFWPDEVDALQSALGRSQTNEAGLFVDSLRQSGHGRRVCDKWLKILVAQSYRGDAWSEVLGSPDAELEDMPSVSLDLLMLCIALQHVFPTDTLMEPGYECSQAIRSLVPLGLNDGGVPIRLSRKLSKQQRRLCDDICRRLPPRYQSDGVGRSDTWSDDPPEPNLWRLTQSS